MFVYQILRYAQDDKMLRMTGISYAQDDRKRSGERKASGQTKDDDCHQTIGNSEILKVVHP